MRKCSHSHEPGTALVWSMYGVNEGLSRELERMQEENYVAGLCYSYHRTACTEDVRPIRF
jgi:hypothetical protein